MAQIQVKDAGGATQTAALVPNTGAQPSADSLPIVPASDAVFRTAPATATLASISGTIAAGGTAQQIAAANAARRGFWIQNHSAGDLWVSTISTAVTSQPSLRIPPGALYESPDGGAGGGAISIIGAITGQAFSGREY